MSSVIILMGEIRESSGNVNILKPPNLHVVFDLWKTIPEHSISCEILTWKGLPRPISGPLGSEWPCWHLWKCPLQICHCCEVGHSRVKVLHAAQLLLAWLPLWRITTHWPSWLHTRRTQRYCTKTNIIVQRLCLRYPVFGRTAAPGCRPAVFAADVHSLFMSFSWRGMLSA